MKKHLTGLVLLSLLLGGCASLVEVGRNDRAKDASMSVWIADVASLGTWLKPL
jgi:uncharacterized protein YcfL